MKWDHAFVNSLFYTDYMLPADVNHKAVFANNETRLGDISVYGFDYDYTLASYTDELHSLIYKMGQEVLLAKFKVLLS